MTSAAASSITRPSEPPGEPGQVFVLQDYRWVPVIVKRTPTAIECSYEVINGSPTVHAELLSEEDFHYFAHHGEYEALAETAPGATGGFTHIIETPGRYQLLIRNERGAGPVAVSLIVKSTVDPAPSSLSKGISSTRKAVVIFRPVDFCGDSSLAWTTIAARIPRTPHLIVRKLRKLNPKCGVVTVA